MATPVQMPTLSPTMTEGKITKWLKKEGDKVSLAEAIAEVETDKSNLEIESYEDGFLLKILVKEGQSVPVGSPIAYVGEKGEKVSAESPASPPAPVQAAAPAPTDIKLAPAPSSPKAPEPASPKAAPPSSGGQVVPLRREEVAEGAVRLRASPLAKR